MDNCNFENFFKLFCRNFNSYVVSDLQRYKILFSAEMKDKIYTDPGYVSKIIRGRIKVPIGIIERYVKNKDELEKEIQNTYKRYLLNPEEVTQSIRELVLNDPNITKEKKTSLEIQYKDSKDIEKRNIMYITEVLYMILANQKNTRKLTNTGKTVLVETKDLILGSRPPEPCSYFSGREEEMEDLHNKLNIHKHIIVRGIPGIGKSQLVIAYAKQYADEYADILYINYGGDQNYNYSGDLKNYIAQMKFSTDTLDQSDDEKFERHDFTLKNLPDNVLLIIDNYNKDFCDDETMEYVFNTYSCKVVVTSRNVFEEKCVINVKEIGDLKILHSIFDEITGKVSDKLKLREKTIKQIIELLYRHTFVIVLAAKLVNTGTVTLGELYSKLLVEKIKINITDKFKMHKDSQERKATYYEHIRFLFKLSNLSDEETNIIKALMFIPESGIGSREFKEMLELPHLDNVNLLAEKGYVEKANGIVIFLHNMIREVAIAEKELPSITECKRIIEYITSICKDTLKFYGHYRLFIEIGERIIKDGRVDDYNKYINFIQDMFDYMGKYNYRYSSERIELLELLETTINSHSERGEIIVDNIAWIYYAKANLCTDIEKQIELLTKAEQLTEVEEFERFDLKVNILNNLAVCYIKLHRYERAWRSLEMIKVLCKEVGYLKPEGHIVQEYNRVLAAIKLFGHNKAMEILNKVINEETNDDVNNSEEMGDIYLLRGSIFASVGDKARAINDLRQALYIYKEAFAEESKNLIENEKTSERYAEVTRFSMLLKACCLNSDTKRLQFCWGLFYISENNMQVLQKAGLPNVNRVYIN